MKKVLIFKSLQRRSIQETFVLSAIPQQIVLRVDLQYPFSCQQESQERMGSGDEFLGPTWISHSQMTIFRLL